MILYHISPETYDYPIDVFIPRIPKNRMKNENDTINRVCLSDTLCGCLSAMPSGGLDIFEKINKNGLTVPMYVYEFEVDIKNLKALEENGKRLLITPEELVNEKLVDDAIINGEYWLLEEITPINYYVAVFSDIESDWVESDRKDSVESEYFILQNFNIEKIEDFIETDIITITLKEDFNDFLKNQINEIFNILSKKSPII